MHVFLSAVLAFVIWASLALAGALVSSLPVMWLWNAVVPAVFGLKALTWDQALDLCLLCAVLFRASSAPVRKELQIDKATPEKARD